MGYASDIAKPYQLCDQQRDCAAVKSLYKRNAELTNSVGSKYQTLFSELFTCTRYLHSQESCENLQGKGFYKPAGTSWAYSLLARGRRQRETCPPPGTRPVRAAAHQ